MNDPIQSKRPSEDDEFYLTWGRETIKKNIELVQSVLIQMITLNTALLGANIIFLKPGAISGYWQSASLAGFFLALAVAFIGIHPHESLVSTISPEQIKSHKVAALKKKRRFMWSSAILTLSGLLILAIGVINA